MKIYSIYLAKNTSNNKFYIGFDSNWPHRKRAHISFSKTDKDNYFHRSIAKYGPNSFTWEVLYQSLDKDHCLEMEEFFIQQFNSRENGYNIATGGSAPMLGKQLSETHKSKIGLAHKGRKLTDEIKDKISKTLTGRKLPKEQYEKLVSRMRCAFKGKKHSELSKDKMSKNRLGMKFSETHKENLSKSHMGKKFSKETREKMSLKRKGKHWKLDSNGKRVWY